MSESINVLRKFQCHEKSKWKDEAQWYRDNWGWISYSKAIALQVRHRMQELPVTQKLLAEKMGCSQQYISLILKGNENLTLETISKLENSLDFKILRLWDSSSIYSNHNGTRAYLSDPEEPYNSLPE